MFVRIKQSSKYLTPKKKYIMQTFITGKLALVGEIETKPNYSSQRLEILVREFNPDNGEFKGGQTFPITIFNKKIGEINAKELVGKHVVAKCYIKSLQSVKEGTTYNNLALNAVSVKEA